MSNATDKRRQTILDNGGFRPIGQKAAATNKAKYGQDFYKNIGGLNLESWIANGRKPRGFAAVPGLAKRAGKIGGTISRRGPAKPKTITEDRFLIIDEQAAVPIIELGTPSFWNKLRRKV